MMFGGIVALTGVVGMSLVNTDAPVIEGKYYGYFAEFGPDGQQVISKESVQFENSPRGITAKLNGFDIVSREREMRIEAKHGVLIGYYFADTPRGAGGVSYVLNGDAKTGFVGQWTGTDPEQKTLVSGPYVLTQEFDKSLVEKQFAEWLKTPLRSSPKL